MVEPRHTGARRRRSSPASDCRGCGCRIDRRRAAISTLGLLGIQGTLSRISQITGSLATRPAGSATPSGSGGAGAFEAELARRAAASLGGSDTGADPLGATPAFGANSLGGLGSALGLGGGQPTVLAAPTTMTLPAGASVSLPGLAPIPSSVGVPVLPLPASAEVVGGPGGAGPLGQRIAAIAAAELGVEESPKGSNDAPRIAEYRTATVGSSPAPWCAYFTSWVGRQAGIPIGEGGKGEGWVPAVKEWGESTGRYIPPGSAPPQAGDMVLFDRAGDGVLDHIGIVTGVAADGSISTVEGNSSDAVSARRYGPGEYAGLVRLAPPGV